MILADTSAWVEYDRATGSTTDRRISELIATEGSVAVTEPVIMEVLAGARSDAREADLRRLLLRFRLYHFDAVADFDGAVRIYRKCQAGRCHPRGPDRLHDRRSRLAGASRHPRPRRRSRPGGTSRRDRPGPAITG